MSNIRAVTETVNGEVPIHSTIEETSAWKDFLALIKVGIVNSNMITTFTGLWLAIHFTGVSFLHNLDLVFFALAGSVFIISGSCSFNNYYDRNIDHLMERTKNRPTVTGKVSSSKSINIKLCFYCNRTSIVGACKHYYGYSRVCWSLRLYCFIHNDDKA